MWWHIESSVVGSGHEDGVRANTRTCAMNKQRCTVARRGEKEEKPVRHRRKEDARISHTSQGAENRGGAGPSAGLEAFVVRINQS